MVAPYKVEFCLLHEIPDVRLFQVIQLVMVGCTKISAQTTVLIGDNHTTAAGRVVVVHTIFDVDTGLLARRKQHVCIFITTYTADVQNA